MILFYNPLLVVAFINQISEISVTEKQIRITQRVFTPKHRFDGIRYPQLNVFISHIRYSCRVQLFFLTYEISKNKKQTLRHTKNSVQEN